MRNDYYWFDRQEAMERWDRVETDAILLHLKSIITRSCKEMFEQDETRDRFANWFVESWMEKYGTATLAAFRWPSRHEQKQFHDLARLIRQHAPGFIPAWRG